MNELTVLTEGRKILRSIRAQRLWCMKHRKGYVETDWAKKELNNLDYALSTINTSAKMKKFLEQKEPVIHFLMPARNTRQHQRLKELIAINS
jgi:hypothetical protein